MGTVEAGRPPASRPSRRPRVLAYSGAVALVLGGFMLGGFMLGRWWADPGDHPVPAAALAAARAAYAERTGNQKVAVDSAAGWGDCVVVQLNGIPGTGVISMVVTGAGTSWTIARVSGDGEITFDPDDVSTRAACWELARPESR